MQFKYYFSISGTCPTVYQTHFGLYTILNSIKIALRDVLLSVQTVKTLVKRAGRGLRLLLRQYRMADLWSAVGCRLVGNWHLDVEKTQT
jgi:hypothetical protein